MRVLPRRPSAVGWYVAGSLAATAAHLTLPVAAQLTAYFVIALGAVAPLTIGLRRIPVADRLPGRLLVIALLTLSAGNLAAVADAAGGGNLHSPSELLVTLGHIMLLAAAVSIVRRRGRNDLGGLVDATVTAMGVGGLLWTAVLQPHLAAVGTPVGTQVTVLVNMLVLTGILGALARLLLTAHESLPALRRMVYALVLALIGNTVLALATGFLTVDRPVWVQVAFLLCYTSLGAAGLDPSMIRLLQPGSAPVDRLTTGRLVFLGAALAVPPIVGGGRQLFGLPVDGLLLVASAVAVVPLVMIRIGSLSAQRTRAEAALIHQATHDALTGLANRVRLMARLSAALAGPAEVAVLFCDLDGFKAINDRLGHAAGDDLLVQVAGRLASCVVEGDTLARYGGDEFVLVCRDAAAELAIRRAMSHPFLIGAEQVSVGASVGVVQAPSGTDPDLLIRRADEAMYQAKRTRIGAAARAA